MAEKLIVTLELFLNKKGEEELSVKFDNASVKSNHLIFLTKNFVNNIKSDIEHKFHNAQELTDLQLKLLNCSCDEDVD